MWTGRGDSGAPIFVRNDPADPNNHSVTLMGMHSGSVISTIWNGSEVGSTSYYTGYRSFENELGVLDQGALNPRTSISVGTPGNFGYSYPGGQLLLQWSGASVSGTASPTQYRVLTWTSQYYADQEGNSQAYISSPGVIATVSGLSYAPGASSPATACGGYYPDGTVITHFAIQAINQIPGVRTVDHCFQ